METLAFSRLYNRQKKGVVFANWSFCAMVIEEDVFRAKSKKKERTENKSSVDGSTSLPY